MTIESSARFALMLGLVSGSAVAWANSYVLVDLGRKMEVHQIGNGGQIVATSLRGRVGAAEWRHGKWHFLEHGDEAFAVNSRGEVAGYGSNGFAVYWPTTWSRQGVPTSLQMPEGNTSQGYAMAIADDGWSAGWYEASRYACFLADPQGIATSLNFPGEVCYTSAMNNRHQIVGQATFKLDRVDAFLWSSGEFTDLGGLAGSDDTYAESINNEGVVVGESEYPDGNRYIGRCWKWKDGVMTEFGRSPAWVSCIPFSVNDHGQIVGGAVEATSWRFHAVRFEDGEIVDLEDEVDSLDHWELVEATSVTDVGIIGGWGISGSDGQIHGFMLIPH